MKININYQTIENGQMALDTYNIAFSNDQLREAAGFFGGLLGGAFGTLVGGLTGATIDMDDGVGSIALGAFLGGQAGGEAGSELGKFIYDELNKQYEPLSEVEKQAWREQGFIPYSPNDPENYNPNNLPYDPNNIIPNTPTDPFTPEPNPDDGHPFDPERFDPPRRDPLVLDMNKDGLISTVSLADSTAFFDLTGDGIKEKVGWIQASEGIVAFDKNGNGKIDGIGEVFGTATTSGFAELRSLADSNYDNVIDRRDELYNQLKVWQDTNQDGISQANELKTLAEAGVNNIELDVFATNINLNGNLLTEAGRYSDSTGTRSLAADVELTFDARITTVDTSLIPDYTIHPESLTLPKLRGYGTVYNSEIAYNVNPNLLTLAQSLTSDPSIVAKNFDTFLEEWSRLNTLLQMINSKNFKNKIMVA